MSQTTPTLFTRCAGLLSVAVFAVVAAACSDDKASAPTSTFPLLPRIAVTAVKGDATSELLAAIFARVLDDAGFRVARKDPVDLDRAGYIQALQDGEFQLIPDFSGDLQEFVFSQPGSDPIPTTSLPDGVATTQAPVTIPASTTSTTSTTSTIASTTTTSAADTSSTTTSTDTSTDTSTTTTSTTTSTTTTIVETTLETTTTVVAAQLSGRSVPEQLISINEAMPASIFANRAALAERKTVIACTTETMRANEGTQLVSLADLAAIAPNIRLGGSAEFMSDEEFGYPVFQRLYGGDFAEVITFADNEMATAVGQGTVDCVALESLDPLITAERLTILVDDRHMAAGNGVVALASTNVSTPDLLSTLDLLISSLTSERLNQMLYEVVTNGTDPAIVANAFIDTL
ncbi:MAG: hypothetical protein HY826_14540 [Actinobacteria bacterium]|nr:hypothetical protein [Actinomycetota bacterium]